MKKSVSDHARPQDLSTGASGGLSEQSGLSQDDPLNPVCEAKLQHYERSSRFLTVQGKLDLIKHAVDLSIRTRQLVEEIREHQYIEEALRKSEQELSFRNRIADIFLKHSDRELFEEVLKVIMEAMSSPQGTISHIDREGTFIRPTVLLNDKQTSPPNSCFACSIWGKTIWANALLKKQSLICNEPCEMPEGHVRVMRGMIAPIVHNDKLVGFFGVANKPTDYTEEDKQRLEMFSAYIAPILAAKLQRDVLEFKRSEAERELAESREQLRALAANLEEVREEERKVIAREIHDEFGQALTCLKMDLSYLSRRMHEDQADLLEKLNSMMRLIDNNIQLIRDVSSQLRPGILDDFGLLSAVEWQLQSFSIRTGIQYRINSNLDGKELDSKIRTALFRIFQEALTNVVRHSGANEVFIELNRNGEGTLVMGIDDNGKGISEEAINDKKSLGILGMRERTVLLGGKFRIESAKDKGTKIRVGIPLREI